MTIRQAAAVDVGSIQAIIMHHASLGRMLPRSADLIRNSIETYVVAEADGRVIGCGSLQLYSSSLAEICCLATAPGVEGKGVGREIVNSLKARAAEGSIARVFALTLVPEFFEKLGFRATAPGDIPEKVWKDCVMCPRYGFCQEVAMVIELGSPATANQIMYTGAISGR